MESYEQLELFDLRPYTSKMLVLVSVVEEQFVRVPQRCKYKQLELELFPPQADQKSMEIATLAA